MTAAPAIRLAPSPADAEAFAHFDANLDALRSRDDLCDFSAKVTATGLPDVEWCRARDGSLTGLCEGGWLGGSSVPARVAARLMPSLKLDTGSACVVAPNHAEHLRVALDENDAGTNHAILAVFTDADHAASILACFDFSSHLTSGRLLPALADDLGRSLPKLVEGRRGWVVPTQLFIPGDASALLGEQDIARLTQTVKAALEAAVQQRRDQQARVTIRHNPGGPLTLVVGGDASPLSPAFGRVHLGRVFAAKSDTRPVNIDSPDAAAPLALMDAMNGASAVIAADIGRGETVGTAGSEVPWLTWVSRQRKPFAFTGGRDAVAVADERWLADWLAAGWPRDRLAVAPWQPSKPSTVASGLLIACDLPDDPVPADLKRYSSQAVLWEQLAHVVERHPFIASDPVNFVQSRATDAGLSLDLSTAAAWVTHCLIPARAIGLARLAATLTPVTAVGSNWSRHPEVKPTTAESCDDWLHITHRAAAIIDPSYDGTPMLRSTGRPVIGGPMTAGEFEAACRKSPSVAADPNPSLADALRQCIDRVFR